ncbi:hypothetical protein [Synechococcus sp. PCC 7336]|uniref:hypothetical protein n=1 Tax=Synechococcus sp. PCC 7336 TaxID=195250 RepID=UPI0003475E70|nr:hypothetical protein [Synechococcus sp. PCC 7336]
MSLATEVQELAIVLSAKEHDPTLLNPEFLRHSGIVPKEWELARDPVRTTRVSQVAFTNGCSVVAQTDRIVFTETLGAKPLGDIITPQIARKYADILSYVDYQGVGVNFRSFVAFKGDADAPRRYLATHLLNAAPWQELGDKPMRASLNLVFTFGDKRLTLNVSEASLQPSPEKSVPVILCTGNFSKDLAKLEREERLQKVGETVEEWMTDLENYKKVTGQLLDKEQDSFVALSSLLPAPELAEV